MHMQPTAYIRVSVSHCFSSEANRVSKLLNIFFFLEGERQILIIAQKNVQDHVFPSKVPVDTFCR